MFINNIKRKKVDDKYRYNSDFVKRIYILRIYLHIYIWKKIYKNINDGYFHGGNSDDLIFKYTFHIFQIAHNEHDILWNIFLDLHFYCKSDPYSV